MLLLEVASRSNDSCRPGPLIENNDYAIPQRHVRAGTSRRHRRKVHDILELLMYIFVPSPFTSHEATSYTHSSSLISRNVRKRRFLHLRPYAQLSDCVGSSKPKDPVRVGLGGKPPLGRPLKGKPPVGIGKPPVGIGNPPVGIGKPPDGTGKG